MSRKRMSPEIGFGSDNKRRRFPPWWYEEGALSPDGPHSSLERSEKRWIKPLYSSSFQILAHLMRNNVEPDQPAQLPQLDTLSDHAQAVMKQHNKLQEEVASSPTLLESREKTLEAGLEEWGITARAMDVATIWIGGSETGVQIPLRYALHRLQFVEMDLRTSLRLTGKLPEESVVFQTYHADDRKLLDYVLFNNHSTYTFEDEPQNRMLVEVHCPGHTYGQKFKMDQTAHMNALRHDWIREYEKWQAERDAESARLKALQDKLDEDIARFTAAEQAARADGGPAPTPEYDFHSVSEQILADSVALDRSELAHRRLSDHRFKPEHGKTYFSQLVYPRVIANRMSPSLDPLELFPDFLERKWPTERITGSSLNSAQRLCHVLLALQSCMCPNYQNVAKLLLRTAAHHWPANSTEWFQLQRVPIAKLFKGLLQQVRREADSVPQNWSQRNEFTYHLHRIGPSNYVSNRTVGPPAKWVHMDAHPQCAIPQKDARYVICVTGNPAMGPWRRWLKTDHVDVTSVWAVTNRLTGGLMVLVAGASTISQADEMDNVADMTFSIKHTLKKTTIKEPTDHTLRLYIERSGGPGEPNELVLHRELFFENPIEFDVYSYGSEKQFMEVVVFMGPCRWGTIPQSALDMNELYISARTFEVNGSLNLVRKRLNKQLPNLRAIETAGHSKSCDIVGHSKCGHLLQFQHRRVLGAYYGPEWLGPEDFKTPDMMPPEILCSRGKCYVVPEAEGAWRELFHSAVHRGYARMPCHKLCTVNRLLGLDPLTGLTEADEPSLKKMYDLDYDPLNKNGKICGTSKSGLFPVTEDDDDDGSLGPYITDLTETLVLHEIDKLVEKGRKFTALYEEYRAKEAVVRTQEWQAKKDAVVDALNNITDQTLTEIDVEATRAPCNCPMCDEWVQKTPVKLGSARHYRDQAVARLQNTRGILISKINKLHMYTVAVKACLKETRAVYKEGEGKNSFKGLQLKRFTTPTMTEMSSMTMALFDIECKLKTATTFISYPGTEWNQLDLHQMLPPTLYQIPALVTDYLECACDEVDPEDGVVSIPARFKPVRLLPCDPREEFMECVNDLVRDSTPDRTHPHHETCKYKPYVHAIVANVTKAAKCVPEKEPDVLPQDEEVEKERVKDAKYDEWEEVRTHTVDQPTHFKSEPLPEYTLPYSKGREWRGNGGNGGLPTSRGLVPLFDIARPNVSIKADEVRVGAQEPAAIRSLNHRIQLSGTFETKSYTRDGVHMLVYDHHAMIFTSKVISGPLPQAASQTPVSQPTMLDSIVFPTCHVWEAAPVAAGHFVAYDRVFIPLMNGKIGILDRQTLCRLPLEEMLVTVEGRFKPYKPYSKNAKAHKEKWFIYQVSPTLMTSRQYDILDLKTQNSHMSFILTPSSLIVTCTSKRHTAPLPKVWTVCISNTGDPRSQLMFHSDHFQHFYVDKDV
uniref:Protein ORF106 n=1 Tax=Anguillid herpesvirus 1 TaxID=150286 RepID=A0A8E5ALN7_9VIRU|nr:protein ORF106 [Anguillid herpesvirus 1]